jgi:inner membrane protein
LLLVAPFRHVLSKRFLTGALIGSVVLDVDHLPMYAGFDILTRRTTRPYPHSLVTVAAVAGWAALGGSTKRPLALGLAVGFSSHLLRDAATGGEPLFWPWSGRTIRIGWDARRNLGESWLEVLPCRGAQI